MSPSAPLDNTATVTSGALEESDSEQVPMDIPVMGEGNTPGFWKNHEDIFEQETGVSGDTRYEEVFGVDVIGGGKVSSDPTLLEALDANGGGEAALLRASTAAWANAESDDVRFEIDPIALLEVIDDGDGIISQDELDERDEAVAYLQGLDTVDDDVLSGDEVIAAVQDVYDPSFDRADAVELAHYLDLMNNMPSVETSEFVA